ncbi:ABC transporter ATP-binding protein [Streptomyces sodiiphilus]|uniref:ABC transporter ATP-binding protein n=1 Tax=Streptomyces sodiiphilus TaxID=226217 RepID=A0ABP5AAR8_9ACTN
MTAPTANPPGAATAGTPPDAPRPDSGHTVWQIAARHRKLLVTGVLLGVLGAAAALGQPLAIGEMIRAAGLGESLAGPITVMILLFCADAAFSAVHAYLIGRSGENIVFDVRRSLTGRLLRADLAAFGRHQQGDIFTRMVTDTSLARVALAQSLSQLVISGFMVAGGIALMLWIDVWLLLLTLLCLGLASGMSVWLARRLRIVAVQNREDTGAFGSDLQRALSALPTVKASRAEEREQRRISGLAWQARRSGVKVSALNAMLSPAMNVGLQVSLAVVIGVGMTRVTTGSLPLADLTAFVMYLFYLVSPLVMFFLSIGQFQQGRAAIQRVDELAGLPQEEDEPAGPPAAPAGGTPAAAAADTAGPAGEEPPAVEFRDVRFAYGAGDDERDREILAGVSFRVPARGLTAIVGPSGAGKTTLFQLVERFHRPTGGSILLSGADIATLPLDTLRGTVGYVQQDSAAMRGTIRENLVYANPSATEEEIREAVETAGLADVVDRLPQGLETPLGEQGSGLSGGQRQRLCIARTLLQKPAVMLLDEATSHLDSDAELAFRRALRRISGRCAVVAIAHRISTVVDADRIVVLEDGQVRDIGAHGPLMERSELYRRLAGSQLNAGVRADAGPDGVGTGAGQRALV